MQEKKKYNAPEIEWVSLYEGSEGERVLFESAGLTSNDYDFGKGAWW